MAGESKKWMELDRRVHMGTYARLPIVAAKAAGARLWDVEGREYIDFLAGLGAVNMGHGRAEVIDAFCRQARELDHISNLFYSPAQIRLAEKLAEKTGGLCFFANSGAEANEGALKLARRWAKENVGPEKTNFVTTLGSFHGRTLATLAATGQPEKIAPFAPPMPGFAHVPYNDLDALAETLDDTVCAVMLESIQGEGGVWPADPDYLTEVRRLCDERRVLLIMDEVQTGVGRTGRFFGFEHYGITPDIVTLAKSLANGFPIGAFIAKPEIAAAFKPGDHGSTFGGNAPVCAGALAVLDVLEKDGLAERAADMGGYFRDQLRRAADETGALTEITGLGLMIGATLKEGGARNTALALLEKGFIINNIGDTRLRFLPPLIISKEDIDNLVEALKNELVG
jgi:predicted acetylornithine/succinylornithine family transaminase